MQKPSLYHLILKITAIIPSSLALVSKTKGFFEPGVGQYFCTCQLLLEKCCLTLCGQLVDGVLLLQIVKGHSLGPCGEHGTSFHRSREDQNAARLANALWYLESLLLSWLYWILSSIHSPSAGSVRLVHQVIISKLYYVAGITKSSNLHKKVDSFLL